MNEAQQLTTIWQQLARDNLAFFMEYESGGAWQPAPHLSLLCEKLQAVERGEIKRLMVFVGPRHGKSEVISKKFPAWYLGRHPNDEIMMSSYAAELAEDHSKIARDTLKEWGPKLWGITVAKESAAVNRWSVAKHRGGLTAIGVGGAATGRGAKIALIDDPVKNMEEAESESTRRKIWNWYRTVLRTRLAPGGAIVLVMTRWHEQDLAGLLTAEMNSGEGEQWEIISLPAEAEENDALGREVGAWLWPERFSPDEYTSTKSAVGSRAWAALYQQRPTPDEGNIFKRQWFENSYYLTLPDKFDEVIQSWDCTFKDTKGTDYVVGQVWGKKGADKYLLDQVRERMDLPKTLMSIRRISAKWPQARLKLIEDKANGPAVIQMLRKEISGLVAVNPEGGKVARANAVAPDVEAGNVHLPHPSIAPWVEINIDEACSLPNGAFDDTIDSTSQALNRLIRRRHLGLVAKPAGW